MQDKILKIITDALKGADAKFDTDGQTVWVDGKDGRTFAVCVSECVGDADADEDDQTYTVHLHASFMGAFDVKSKDLRPYCRSSCQSTGPGGLQRQGVRT